MARPRMNNDDQRNCWLKARASSAERAAIKSRAAASGLSLSEYLRQQAIHGAIIQKTPLADRELTRSLAAIGNNLNQIARKANMTGELRGDLEARLHEALGHLEGVIEELIQ